VAKKSAWFTRGSLTFKEAYLRTGRVLNISVIPADRHSPTKLLNYMTAPDTVIWSALLASAAVPGIINPVVVMQKLKNGCIVPWNWGSRFKDGSLRVDIPLQSLNLYFNVTHPIVSQVNPHVHLFFFAPRGSAGKPVAHRKRKGWRGNFLLSAAEQWLKHELTKNFKVIRDLELLPQLLGQDWSTVFLQRFDGAVTIWPKTRAWDWVRILSDPDEIELARMIRIGQVVTWPKLHMIENRMRLEKQILLGRQAIRKQIRKSTRGPLIDRQRRENGHPSIPGRSPSPPATGSDMPLSVDTDAEAAFANGSRWFFKRGHAPVSPSNSDTSGPREGRVDPLRAAALRRKWAELLHPPSNGPVQDNYYTQTPRPSLATAKRNNSGFFGSLPARLRTTSFPNLSIPTFSRAGNAADMQQPRTPGERDGWKSDSSSDEELWSDDEPSPEKYTFTTENDEFT